MKSFAPGQLQDQAERVDELRASALKARAVWREIHSLEASMLMELRLMRENGITGERYQKATEKYDEVALECHRTCSIWLTELDLYVKAYNRWIDLHLLLAPDIRNL